jgi:pSer/pThr/pTyr-binding forkhead associated (FHA) protein
VITASIAFEEVLLLLKIAFVVVLYLYLWRIVRTASRDLRTPQESFVLAPQQVRKAVPERKPVGRLVLVTKTGTGSAFPLDSAAITIGRGGSNDVALDDDFASTQHARIEPRRDGVWVEDIGSTNGTAVNGQLLAEPRKLSVGDVIRVGETDLRYER